ncbi:hypothetical protein C8R44DRAFT_885175 [Mycena epipterygia]|nr:hypothetical protein C8R44DRAFT_885175 [Mycena epipterygia]
MQKPIQVYGDDSALPFPRLASTPQPSEKIRAPSNPVTIECLRTLRIENWRQRSRSHPPKLDMFPEMHIDIVLEVLGHLHPLDLIHVSRSNHEFRALLRAPVTATIWRESFVAPLPVCPSDIPGRRWAHLIFDPLRCEKCGAPETSPDYIIRRRLCSGCIRNRLRSSISGYHRVPGIPSCSHDVYKLLAKTLRERRSRQIYEPDSLPVVGQYENLLADDGPGAALALANFVKKRKQIVQEIEKASRDCEQWVARILQQAKDHNAENLKKVLAVTKRLLEDGQDLQDITRRPFKSLTLNGIPRLSSKRWNKARPEIFASVNSSKISRLWNERSGRRGVVRSGIIAIMKAKFPPSTWAYSPTVDNIVEWVQFAELIDSTINATLAVDDSRLVAALERLPADLEVWRITQQMHLASKIPGAGQPPDLRTLELATSAFGYDDCLIGWLDAGPYLTSNSLPFSATFSAAARTLVLFVDLDPGTTTATTMDDMDDRFLCRVCPVTPRGPEAMSWRTCLLHAMGHPSDPPVATSWARLSPEGAADIRRREGADRSCTDDAWICNMCPAHFDYHKRVVRAEAISHVASEHAVPRPVEGVHFLYDLRRTDRTLRHPPVFMFGPAHPAEYRCNHCAEKSPGLVTLLSLRSMVAHVKNRHNVGPTEDHWRRVERVLT